MDDRALSYTVGKRGVRFRLRISLHLLHTECSNVKMSSFYRFQIFFIGGETTVLLPQRLKLGTCLCVYIVGRKRQLILAATQRLPRRRACHGVGALRRRVSANVSLHKVTHVHIGEIHTLQVRIVERRVR